MYQTRKTFIKPDQKVSDLIFENSTLLLMMEYFDLDIVVQDKTVTQICEENNIGTHVFISIGNLYNGFKPSGTSEFSSQDIPVLIRFLRNTHRYYLEEKIPDVLEDINKLYAKNSSREIQLVEQFFWDYSQEVKEHLNYEDQIAFPYFLGLINEKNDINNKFSSSDYLEHHTDIETKLADLKQLLLMHISIKNDLRLRRRLLLGLFELEYNLTIHSLIEESILIPLIKNIEKQQTLG